MFQAAQQELPAAVFFAAKNRFNDTENNKSR